MRCVARGVLLFCGPLLGAWSPRRSDDVGKPSRTSVPVCRGLDWMWVMFNPKTQQVTGSFSCVSSLVLWVGSQKQVRSVQKNDDDVMEARAQPRFGISLAAVTRALGLVVTFETGDDLDQEVIVSDQVSPIPDRYPSHLCPHHPPCVVKVYASSSACFCHQEPRHGVETLARQPSRVDGYMSHN